RCRVESEGGEPPVDLAVVEPVMLQVLEQVPCQPELGRRDGAASGEFEGHGGLSVMEDEQVVLVEAVATRPALEDGRSLAVAADGELERRGRGMCRPSVPSLPEQTSAAVDDAKAAAETVVEGVQQRFEAAPLEDERRQPLVHRERVRHQLELLPG